MSRLLRPLALLHSAQLQAGLALKPVGLCNHPGEISTRLGLGPPDHSICSSASRAFASIRSTVSNSSVNQL
jgi:hypothetical protein